MTTVYFNETELNGKFQVMTTVELTGKGIKKVGQNSILSHKNEIIKNLKNYWVSKAALVMIKLTNNTERACF